MDDMPALKILLAEDEREVARYLGDGLKKTGFAPDLAFDGEEAKNMIKAKVYDVIILDMIMPRFSGWQILQWLKQELKLKTPVIIISAQNKVKDIERGYALKADHYLVKPFKLNDLIKGIKTVWSLAQLDQNDA